MEMVTYIDALPKELRDQLGVFRIQYLCDIINGLFEKYKVVSYGPSKPWITNDINIAETKLSQPVIKVKLVLVEFARECYNIYFQLNDTITFEKLLFLFNHLLNSGYYIDSIVNSLNDKLIYVIRELNTELSKQKYSERFIIFPHDNSNEVMLMNCSTLEKK